MPKISSPQAVAPIKALLIGPSGSGKTGSLISLARVGYNLRIVDFDNGVDILKTLVKHEKPEVADRIIFETFTDRFKTIGGKPQVSGVPQAFTKAMNLLNKWSVAGEGAYDLGSVDSWGPSDVLVIDSLTHLSNAAFRHVLALNGRLGTQPHQSDYGVAQGNIENLLAMLYSTDIRCNVIIISHITYLGGEEGDPQPLRGLPTSLGKALSPKIGSYFNTLLMVKVIGSGANAKRQIVTAPDGLVDLKNSAPLDLPRTLPLETGLAEVFKALSPPGFVPNAPPPPAEVTIGSAIAPAAAEAAPGPASAPRLVPARLPLSRP